MAPEAEALEAEARSEVGRTHHLAPAKMATYLPHSHLAMVRGDWGDRGRLAYQALEAEARSAEARSAEVLEAEVVEAEALEAVRGRCQNRQIQEEGGVLRALPARL